MQLSSDTITVTKTYCFANGSPFSKNVYIECIRKDLSWVMTSFAVSFLKALLTLNAINCWGTPDSEQHRISTGQKICNFILLFCLLFYVTCSYLWPTPTQILTIMVCFKSLSVLYVCTIRCCYFKMMLLLRPLSHFVFFLSSTADRHHVQAEEAMMWLFYKELKFYIIKLS